MSNSILAQFSTQDLVAEIKQRKSSMQSLMNKMDSEISTIDSVGKSKETTKKISLKPVKKTKIIAVRKSKKSVKTTKRIRDEKPLIVRIEEVLKSSKEQSMSIHNIVEALKANGWRTSSEKPYYPVASALSSNKDKFRKVARGEYALVELPSSPQEEQVTEEVITNN